MATRNSTTPSGGIFRSQLGGLIGFGPTQYMGRGRLEQFGQDIMLHVPGARTPVRQDPRPVTEFLGELGFLRRAQIQPRANVPGGAFVPGRTQLPQHPQAAQPPHQPMH
ncbi:hypothetical protein AAC978_11340 [Desulfitobacterium sp. THU1]|uniref:hypothetical protein n=1 Tax=Desulfitobacterium sp. THU1 TaxID=3138072 RepID=UPI00311E364F